MSRLARARQVRRRQIRPDEVRVNKARAAEIRALEIRARCVGAGEVRLFQVAPTADRAAQRGRVAEVAPREILIRSWCAVRRWVAGAGCLNVGVAPLLSVFTFRAATMILGWSRLILPPLAAVPTIVPIAIASARSAMAASVASPFRGALFAGGVGRQAQQGGDNGRSESGAPGPRGRKVHCQLVETCTVQFSAPLRPSDVG